ncbi:MAG TPA: OB-fold nucleic acid binding domain-containing protein, partial [Brumimicrobium sp.]|nr:OB-fold nucleic acid binding domain-containing protein [Brumimicrobium sp.]
MKHTKIKALLESSEVGGKVIVKGWVRAFRSNRFIQINDGSTINNIQAVIEYENFDEVLLKKVNTAAAIEVRGTLVESEGKGQAFEIVVDSLEILGEAN